MRGCMVNKGKTTKPTKSTKSTGHFNFVQMTTLQRYLFLGTAIIAIVLICFFAGLFIDYMFKQPATVALWDIAIGSVLAIVFTWRQLVKLVDTTPKVTTKRKSHKEIRNDRKKTASGLTVEEERILAESQGADKKSKRSAKANND